jgi:hypothetical protein
MPIDKSLIVQLVSTPRSELFSATQLWKMMGGVSRLHPHEYFRLNSTHRFIQAEYPEASLSIENQGLPVKSREIPTFIPDSIYKVFRGRNGGTYMEKKLLLDYAQWLSPEIKSMVLDTFIEYGQIMVEQDPDKKAKALIEKGFDAAVNLQAQGESAEDTEEDKFERLKRAASVATRKLFMSELEVITGQRMVDSPKLRQFVAYITDRLYVHILGDTTRGLRKGLGLGTHSTPRDAMNDSYLTAIHFAERAIIRHLRQNRDSVTPSEVEAVIVKVAAVQRPMLDMVDDWEPVALHTRKRKGSGFTKGVYEANRGQLQKSLNYTKDSLPVHRQLN